MSHNRRSTRPRTTGTESRRCLRHDTWTWCRAFIVRRRTISRGRRAWRTVARARVPAIVSAAGNHGGADDKYDQEHSAVHGSIPENVMHSSVADITHRVTFRRRNVLPRSAGNLPHGWWITTDRSEHVNRADPRRSAASVAAGQSNGVPAMRSPPPGTRGLKALRAVVRRHPANTEGGPVGLRSSPVARRSPGCGTASRRRPCSARAD